MSKKLFEIKSDIKLEDIQVDRILLGMCIMDKRTCKLRKEN